MVLKVPRIPRAPSSDGMVAGLAGVTARVDGREEVPETSLYVHGWPSRLHVQHLGLPSSHYNNVRR